MKHIFCLLNIFLVHNYCADAYSILKYTGDYRLDIIHYNDFHARFLETSLKEPICKSQDSKCIGGFARLYGQIRRMLKERPSALLLNAGDTFQGTPWFNILGWNVTQYFMNMLPHDAYTLGNHEFDLGVEGLVPYLSGLKAPMLVANMDSSSEPSLTPFYKNHLIVQRNGRSIGIIGVIISATNTMSKTGKVQFRDAGETVRQQARLLRDKGIDIIIVLSHCGLPTDREIAARYGEDIDLIVGGHTHTLLYNGTAPSGEVPEDTYPVMVNNNARGHTILIVTAACFTKYLGNLSISFNHNGEIVSWEGEPIFLDRSIAEDPTILEELKPYAAEVNAATKRKIGESLMEFDSEDCVGGECTLGDMVCDAFREWASGKQNLRSSTQSIMCLLNRGALRANLDKGPISYGDLLNVMPYSNLLQTIRLQGRYVLEALEHAVSSSWKENPWIGPYVLQVSGVKVVYNVTLPVGKRIISAQVHIAQSDKYENIKPDKDYGIVTIGFLAFGGDNFTMISKNKKDVRFGPRDINAFETYIRKYSPISMKLQNRVSILT